MIFIVYPTPLFTVAVFCACRALCFCSNSLTVVFTRTPWYTLGLSAEKEPPSFFISVYFHSPLGYALIFNILLFFFVQMYICKWFCAEKYFHVNRTFSFPKREILTYWNQFLHKSLFKTMDLLRCSKIHTFLRGFKVKDVVYQPFFFKRFIWIHFYTYKFKKISVYISVAYPISNLWIYLFYLEKCVLIWLPK